MNLTVASSPHIRGNFRSSRLMLDVVIALMPGLLAGVLVLGLRCLLVVAVSVASAVASEWLYCLALRKRQTVIDGSSLVTGLLLALTLPSTVPLYLAALGSVFAVVVVKLLCGGLGQNVFNPALTARALLVLAVPAAMTVYPHLDGATSATPMHQMAMYQLPDQGISNLFLGNIPGSIGELSAFALILGFVYLVLRGVISLRIPLAYVGTVAVITFLFPRGSAALPWMLSQVLGGGLLLGAIFMATDYATSPVTPVGQVLYGIGCGGLTVLFRYFGLYPEGVTYAILTMNALTWLIDRFTPPSRFGTKEEDLP